MYTLHSGIHSQEYGKNTLGVGVMWCDSDTTEARLEIIMCKTILCVQKPHPPPFPLLSVYKVSKCVPCKGVAACV